MSDLQLGEVLDRVRAGTSCALRGARLPRRSEEGPIVALVCCADIGESPEQRLGLPADDVFVAQGLSTLVTPDLAASVGYGVVAHDIPLVLVLGHEDCRVIRDVAEGACLGPVGRVILRALPPRGLPTRHRDGSRVAHASRLLAELAAEELRAIDIIGERAEVRAAFLRADGAVEIL